MSLIEQLQNYSPYDPTETAHLNRVITFLQQTEHPFHRETLEGHITSSAIVMNVAYSQILLLHHRKLGGWVQPGGHCDGNSNTLSVALQEVHEETGLTSMIPVSETVFDLDVHRIPPRGDVLEHWHYDIRYLLVADDQEPLQKSEREAIALQWVPLTQLTQFNPDESLQRIKQKLSSRSSPNLQR
jgi:8-oxo-dGTP pyrophosphatase MutT (NUDIX family)